VLPQSLADAALDERKPHTRAAEVPRCILADAACRLRRWVVPSTTHLRESRVSHRLALGPVSRMLIQLGTPCHAPFGADICSHIEAPREVESAPREVEPHLAKPAAVAARRTVETHKAFRTMRSLHTLRGAWRVAQQAIGSRARNCPVHGGVDTDASTLSARRVRDTRANRSPSASFLAVRHRMVSR
jgi:hypothetical protein